MRKLLLFCWLQIIVISGLAAQYAPTAAENSLLWEIQGKELKQPSFLFGTIHLIGKKDFELTDATRAALDKAQSVVFEINMEQMTNAGALLPLIMKAFMADGKTLRSLLPDTDYTLVRNHFEDLGLPMFMLERIKPMFLSALGSADLGKSSDTEESVSYEIELMKIARQQRKKIDGLETIEFQMSIFDSIPYEAQAQMLVEQIRAGERGNDQFAQLVERYKQQDLIGLQHMMEQDAETSSYSDILLVRRNQAWIPRMSDMMRKKPTFFAVGAGHLAGEQGVIALLRQAGYTVQPLK